MWEYSYYPSTDELYHHGILGMHWGKRNGPPYPLGASDHSSSEKKAGWRKSLGKEGRQSRAQAKVDKRRAKLDMANAKAVNRQEKYNAKRNAKIDKKIKKYRDSGRDKKADVLEVKQKYDKQWQKEYIKSVNAGYKQYKDNELVYKQMKVDAITNPKLKKTNAYKSAGKDYVAQKAGELLYESYYGPTTGRQFVIDQYAREDYVKVRKEIAKKRREEVDKVKDKYV